MVVLCDVLCCPSCLLLLSSRGIFVMLSFLMLDDNLKLWGHSVYHSFAANT